MNRPPSGFQIEKVLAAWQAARQELLQRDAALAEDETALAELLRTETKDVDDLVVRLVLAKQDADLMEQGIKWEIDQLKARRERFEKLSDDCKRWAEQILEIMDWPVIRKPRFTVSKGTSAPSVHVPNPDLVPDKYCRIERTPLKTLIGEAIDAGEDVPYAERTNGKIYMRVTRR
jgi:hypothetical protein